jgi:DNA repair protein RadC
MALGSERVSDDELLAVVLGTGTRGRRVEELAGEMLRVAGGLGPLSRASPHELDAMSGIGPARALRVTAAFHLGRRAFDLDRSAVPSIDSAEDVWTRLRSKIVGQPQEMFFVIGLDVRNRILEDVEVARGTLTGVDVHARDVFRPLIRMSAAAGVLAHNHPSGDPTPSGEDRELTRRMQMIGELIGIPILDHVVVGATAFCSIMEARTTPPRP